jgi:hypothetical protein
VETETNRFSVHYTQLKAADLHEAHILRLACVKFIAMNGQYIIDLEEIVPLDSFRKTLIEFFKKTQKTETLYNTTLQ